MGDGTKKILRVFLSDEFLARSERLIPAACLCFNVDFRDRLEGFLARGGRESPVNGNQVVPVHSCPLCAHGGSYGGLPQDGPRQSVYRHALRGEFQCNLLRFNVKNRGQWSLSVAT